MFEGQKERSDPVISSVYHSETQIEYLCTIQDLLSLETYNMAYHSVSFLRQSSNHSLGTLKGTQANKSFIFIKTREQDSLMYLQNLERSQGCVSYFPTEKSISSLYSRAQLPKSFLSIPEYQLLSNDQRIAVENIFLKYLSCRLLFSEALDISLPLCYFLAQNTFRVSCI